MRKPKKHQQETTDNKTKSQNENRMKEAITARSHYNKMGIVCKNETILTSEFFFAKQINFQKYTYAVFLWHIHSQPDNIIRLYGVLLAAYNCSLFVFVIVFIVQYLTWLNYTFKFSASSTVHSFSFVSFVFFCTKIHA